MSIAARVDEENDEEVVPGTWRNGPNMHDIEEVQGGNVTSRAAKTQRIYLTHYYNSPVGEVCPIPYQRFFSEPLVSSKNKDMLYVIYCV